MPQTGQFVDKNLPNQGIVHGCIAMDQDVSKSHDPPQFWDAGGSLRIDFGKLVQCLANDLELALNRRTELRIRLVVREGLATNEVLNQPRCVQRVPQILSGIRPHKAFPGYALLDHENKDCGCS